MRILNPIIIAMMGFLAIAIIIDGPILLIALTVDATAVFAIEALLAYNTIPSIRKAMVLFKYLPFDLRILTDEAREIYRTDSARKLNDTTLHIIASHKPAPGSDATANFRPPRTSNVLIKVFRLQAGVAALYESTDEIDKLKKRLQRQHNLLVRQVDFTRKKHEMRKLLYRQQHERELGDLVERDLVASTRQISSLLDDLVEHAGELTDEERAQQMKLIKIIVAHCKRKGMLVLASVDSDILSNAQLDIIAHEISVDMRSVGVECAMLVGTENGIPMNCFNVLYDTFYECVIGILANAHPVMLVYISQIDHNSYEARISIEIAIGLDRETAAERIPRLASSTEPLEKVLAEIAADLDERLEKRGFPSAINLEDNLISIVLHVGRDRL